MLQRAAVNSLVRRNADTAELGCEWVETDWRNGSDADQVAVVNKREETNSSAVSGSAVLFLRAELPWKHLFRWIF